MKEIWVETLHGRSNSAIENGTFKWDSIDFRNRKEENCPENRQRKIYTVFRYYKIRKDTESHSKTRRRIQTRHGNIQTIQETYLKTRKHIQTRQENTFKQDKKHLKTRRHIQTSQGSIFKDNETQSNKTRTHI